MKYVETISAASKRKLELFLRRISSCVDRYLSYSVRFDVLQSILGIFIKNDFDILIQASHGLHKLGDIIAHAGMVIPPAVKSNSHGCEGLFVYPQRPLERCSSQVRALICRQPRSHRSQTLIRDQEAEYQPK